MEVDMVFPAELKAMMDAFDLAHSMACQRNLQQPAVMKRQTMDLHKQLHMAKRQRFAGACLSYADFETTPDTMKRMKKKKISKCRQKH